MHCSFDDAISLSDKTVFKNIMLLPTSINVYESPSHRIKTREIPLKKVNKLELLLLVIYVHRIMIINPKQKMIYCKNEGKTQN